MIVVTAGHVDHGKTELVRALTGIDTDRLPEEKARGLSIDLGFAYQSLPGSTTLGFVDVPGHEKFIRNMLAGAGGIDLGLLVVAADDGVMPQTREHLAILDLLGIDQYVVAITKIDRVDADRIREVRQQVETLLGNTGCADLAVFPLCAPGNQGVDALHDALRLRAQEMRARPVEGDFRMAIDRVFTLKGVGLIVTGMVLAGRTCIDNKLVVSPDATAVRVRDIRVHNHSSERAQAGERCAINLAGRGVKPGSVHRGDWLMHPGLCVPTRRIDVDLRVLDAEPGALKHWTPTHLHIAADHLAARVAVLSGGAIAPGDRGLAQLVLERDAFAVHGDRFVLRDQSAQRTLGGGQVIDPFAPKRGRARPSRIAALQAMNRRDPAAVLAALAGISATGVPLAAFRVAMNPGTSRLEAMIDSLSLVRAGRPPREWIFSSSQWQRLLERIEKVVGRFHQTRPDRPGASLGEIQSLLEPYVATPILEAATGVLLREKRLGAGCTRFHLPAYAIQIPQRERQLWARAASSLAPATGSPSSLHQVAEAMGVDRQVLEKSLRRAVELGEMALVARNRYLPVSYLARLGQAAETLAGGSAEGRFTVAGYCELTRTGRNFAIDLLEYFDRLGFTERIGNERRIRRAAATVFAIDEAGRRGRGSHPGGAPGLQIR